eukprot:CAMPEP_0195333332 /NCGR_PEP_ID=MMETSP0708-20121125/13979_1 /TAXON_ID=33640 /ORGANISM="Asterionellopsis glacialis, Strain CCMP134" /LENGTH=96 /DNA_ID=CAMNT_0040402599 /DNA_START=33 /DNA_END=320 /DNA_ORIENTATION=-
MLHAHRHHDIDRAFVIAFAHQGRVTGGVEQEDSVFTVDLIGNLKKIFGVKADLKTFIAVGNGQFFFGRAAVRCVHRQDQPVIVKLQFDRARTFGRN